MNEKHRPVDINFWAIVGFGIALTVITIVVHVVIYFAFMGFPSEEVGPPPSRWAAQQEEQLPQGPRIEGTEPLEDVQQPLKAREAEARSYAWVDAKKGIVRIPVANAIDILADKLPSRPAAKAGGPQPAGWQWPSPSNSGRLSAAKEEGR